MIEKQYYRIDELSQRFGILEADLQYWLDKEQISFVIPQTLQKYVIGGWSKSGDFIGYGAVEYKGLISVPKLDEQKILEKGKASIGECWLEESANINYLAESYDFSVPSPNSFMNSWQPKHVSEITWGRIPAKRYPTASKDPQQNFMLMLESLSDTKSFFKKQKELKDILLSPSLEIKKEELCVSHAQLVELGIVLQEKSTEDVKVLAKNTLHTDVKLEKPVKRSSQLTMLIERIVLAKPNMKAIEVWRQLRVEVQMDVLDREYDTEGILKDMTPSELLWDSRYGHSPSVQKTSFDSKVSRIKKNLGLNKK